MWVHGVKPDYVLILLMCQSGHLANVVSVPFEASGALYMLLYDTLALVCVHPFLAPQSGALRISAYRDFLPSIPIPTTYSF